MAFALTVDGIAKGYALTLIRSSEINTGILTPPPVQLFNNGCYDGLGGALLLTSELEDPALGYFFYGLAHVTDWTPGQMGNYTLNPYANQNASPSSVVATPVNVGGRFFVPRNSTSPKSIVEIDVDGNVLNSWTNTLGVNLFNPCPLPDGSGILYTSNSTSIVYKFTIATAATSVLFTSTQPPTGATQSRNISTTDDDLYCFYARGSSSPSVFQKRAYGDWSLVASYSVPIFPIRDSLYCGGALANKFLFLVTTGAFTVGVYEFDYLTTTLTLIASGLTPLGMSPLTSTKATVGVSVPAEGASGLGQGLLYLLTVPEDGVIYGGTPDPDPGGTVYRKGARCDTDFKKGAQCDTTTRRGAMCSTSYRRGASC